MSCELQRIKTLLNQTTIALYRGEYGYADQHFADLLELIQPWLQQQSEATQQALAPIITAIFEAQLRQDRVWMADLLSYALPYYFESTD